METGFIKLHRKISEWEWYGNVNVFSLFIHIILLANWKDKQWQGMTIKRGSFITSIEHLSKNTGLSTQQTRTGLECLLTNKEINKQTTNKYTLITVNKYDEYQPITNKTTNEQQTGNKQITTTKEYKNIKEYKEKRSVVKSHYSDINSLKDLELEEIANKYQVPLSFVRSKHDDMINWHEKNPTKNYYKNYLSALRDWVKRDALKIKLDYGKQNSEVSI